MAALLEYQCRVTFRGPSPSVTKELGSSSPKATIIALTCVVALDWSKHLDIEESLAEFGWKLIKNC